MAARFRVALHGFSDFERNSLSFCLKHAGEREPAYRQVDRIVDCDFIVADASHEILEGSITRGERMRDTLFIGDKPPRGAVAHLTRPLDPERILRALDSMVFQRAASRRPAEPRAGQTPNEAVELRLPLLDPGKHVPDDLPTLSVEIRFSDIDAETAGASAGESDPTPAQRMAQPAPVPKAMTAAERQAAKAAARRKTRAARLAQQRRDDGTVLEEVLLLDGANEPAAAEFLLEAFGFRVLRTHDMAAAIRILASTPLAAAFVDVAVEGNEGIDGMALCQMIKQRQIAVAGAIPPVMLTSWHGSAAEGVRAKLAGCNAFLVHPVKRGDVARVLEACDVPLPADERSAPR